MENTKIRPGISGVRKMIAAFIKFSRPHTVIGTTLSVLSLYFIAWTNVAPAEFHISGLIIALTSCLGANIYIVGLNQITDIDIDRINKPELPLAAGDFSLQTGRVIILAALAISILLAIGQGKFLAFTVIFSLLIGTAYSLPPVRLKRFHFWASACIFTIRGLIVNIFLFLHFQYLMYGTENIPPKIWALTLFMFGLSLVIAWFKDIPDMLGDRQFQIITLTIKFGAQKVFNFGLGLLAFCYLGMIVAGFIGLPGVNSTVLIISHAFLFAFLFRFARNIDPLKKQQISRFYLFTWILFYAEYIVYAAACLLACWQFIKVKFYVFV